MAEVAVGEVRRSPVFNEVVMEGSEICCESYKKLKLELQKTLSQLSSALTIITLLQENENLLCPVSDWTNGQKLNQDRISVQNEGKESTWNLANSGRYKRLSKPDTRYCQPIPKSVNRYEVLQNLNEPKTGPYNLGLVNTKDLKSEQGVSGKRKQKIIIIGVSHAKGFAAEITHNLRRTFEVTGYVKP
jgi:hypothetical protein